MSTGVLASRLGVTNQTVRNWVRSGEIPAASVRVTPGGHYRLAAEYVRELIPSAA